MSDEKQLLIDSVGSPLNPVINEEILLKAKNLLKPKLRVVAEPIKEQKKKAKKK